MIRNGSLVHSICPTCNHEESRSADKAGGFFGLVPASSAVPTAAPEKQHYEDND